MKVVYRKHPLIHPELETLSDNIKIWRYLDFTKFVSLLDKRALFFCRSDKIGDPFEGSYPETNVKLRQRNFQDWSNKQLEGLSILFNEIRRFTIINCWNISEYESSSLWSLYTKTGQGIAIQSTFGRLKRCFGSEVKPSTIPHKGVFICKVKYIDFKNESIFEDYLLSPFVHKRKSFEHENELRAIIMMVPFKANQNHALSLNPKKIVETPDIFALGEYIDINLEELIENVFVSPFSPDWFRSLVDSVIKKYALNKASVISKLDDSPSF
jgi:hypothetical protein